MCVCVCVCDRLCLLHCSMQTQSPIVILFIYNNISILLPQVGGVDRVCLWLYLTPHAVEPLYKGQFRNCKRFAMQWNLSTKDTLGTGSSFLLSVNL